MFKLFFKNNKFFTFNLKLKENKFKIKSFKNFIFTKYPTFLFFKNNFFKNWNYLIGSPVSPFNVELSANKKLFRKDLKIILIKNRLFFNFFNNNSISPKSSYRSTSFSFFKTFSFKKIFVSNFLYLNKKKINYNQLSYLLKNKNKKKYKIKMSKNWLLAKPYMFLNNSYSSKLYKYYSNYYLFSLFKNYFKIFKKVKKFKFRFKFKKITDLNFKKNFFTKNNLYKFSNNRLHKTFLPFRKSPLVFIFKNIINSQNKIIKTTALFDFNKFIKVNLKKKLKSTSVNKLTRKSILLKKNKIYSKLSLVRYSTISTFLNFFLNKIKKLPKRLKKINIFSKLTFPFFKTYFFFLLFLIDITKKLILFITRLLLAQFLIKNQKFTFFIKI